MMPATNKSTFTLGDLARIALGTSELTTEHLSVLQSLFIILLQKLNCQTETVRIRGLPAICVQQLLKDNQNRSQYNFQFETVKGFQEKYDLLAELERKTQEIQLKMQQHLQQIRNCHKSNEFAAQKWDFYASPTEDLCTLYMKHNQKFCSLAHNPVFNIELHRRVVPLMVLRFKEFEAKIESMQKKIQKMTEESKKTAAKVQCIQFVIKDIEEMRSTLDGWTDNFNQTLLEIQEMLNCKLHRLTLPAIKKYLEPRFTAVQEHLDVLQKKSIKCSSARPLAIENKQMCLSCGRPARKSKYSKPLTSLNTIAVEGKCSRSNPDVLNEPSVLTKIDKERLSVVPPSSQQTSRESSSRRGQLKLLGHGILTNYNSYSNMENKGAARTSIMKNTSTKQSFSRTLEIP